MLFQEKPTQLLHSSSNEKNLEQEIVNISDTLHEEYVSIEPNFKISISKAENLKKAVNPIDQNKIIKTLCSLHNGVFRMSQNLMDL